MAADVVRGHRPRRLPVVLTEKEVRIVLGNLQGTPALVAQMLFTMLPESLKESLQAHLTNVFALHQKDLSDGWGRVELAGTESDACSSASSRHPQARQVSHIAPFSVAPPRWPSAR